MTPENQNQPQSFGQPGSTPTDPAAPSAPQPTAIASTAPETVLPSAAPGSALDSPAATPANPAQPGANPAPTGQAFGAGTPAGYPTAPAGTPTAKPGNKKLIFGLIGGLVVLVLVAGAVMLFMLSKTIRPKDVTKAQAAATLLHNDIRDADTALEDLDITEDSDKVNQAVSRINTKLSDAETQYNKLKSSPIQHDADTKKKFDAFAAKWPTFVTYLRDNASDLKALSPVVTDLGSKSSTLASTPPRTTAELATYLVNYKTILTDSNSQVKKLHLKVTENQQLVALLKTFLDSSIADVTKAQQDLAAGNTTAARSDMIKVQDDESTFVSKGNEVKDKIADRRDQVDPTDQYQAFTSQLDKLAEKVK